MNTLRRVFLTTITIAGMATLSAAAALSDTTAVQSTPAADLDATAIGVDAYIYGYPLVSMEMTRRLATNVASADEERAPMGQFANMRTYLTAKDRDVAAPSADALRSSAWIDVSREPYILTIPEMKGRYYLVAIMDAWSNVFESPGKRTTGTERQTYAITGPGWSGELPAGVTQYRSPTNVVWILGRIHSRGTPADFAEVHTLQDELSLVPLSAYGKPYTPPPGTVDPSIDMKTPVREQVDKADAATFFGVLAEALKKNPPAAADRKMVERLARIGIVPGRDFDLKALPEAMSLALKSAPKLAQAKLLGHAKAIGSHENGWLVPLKTGEYGTDYSQRASIAALALGASRPLDAVYAVAEKDSASHDLDGDHRYIVHFAAGHLPPVKGFWSLTMYDKEHFFVPNALNRYALGAGDPLTTNPDGSVDLYLQKDNPGGDKEANWLPAPAGKFIPVLRLYWPSESKPTILDGSWRPPPVKRAG